MFASMSTLTVSCLRIIIIIIKMHADKSTGKHIQGIIQYDKKRHQTSYEQIDFSLNLKKKKINYMIYIYTGK